MGLLSGVPTLASRFLLSKQSERFLSFIAWVSVLGVALGVLALVVVTSAINGFEGELVRVITGMNGDVVFYSRGEPVGDVEKVEAKLREVLGNVRATTASFVTELMASGPYGVGGAVLEGVDPETAGKVTAVAERIREGRMPQADGEIVVGYALAERIGAKLGSEIRLIAPFIGDSAEDAKAGTGAPRVVQARVVGLVRMGMFEYDSKFVFATLGAVQRFLGQPGKVTSFKIKLAPGSDARLAADRLSGHFGYPFRAKDWGLLNKNLFYAIALEKVVIAILLAAIIIVAAFNVVSTLMMMIHDKTKEISILKAMGFRPAQAFLLFCLLGMGIGLVGTVAGVGGGLGVNWVLARTHWIDLPPEIYYIGYLPVVVRWPEVALIAVLALAVTFVATLFPAFRVARRSPLDGIRYE